MNSNNEKSIDDFNARVLAKVLFTEFALKKESDFIVAYSGGLDSQVMLHCLSRLKYAYPIKLTAAHFDHGLQPDSETWAQQCRTWAEKFSVDYVTVRRDIHKRKGESLEAEAREARYRWLDEISEPGQTIVTAHHANDQAETFLLHLFQGKDIDQLAGIAAERPLVYKSDKRLIRPLLGFTREQLKTYAQGNELRWIEDPSNRDMKFYRNFLRHQLVPLLINREPNFISNLNEAAKICGRISKRDHYEYKDFIERHSSATVRTIFCLCNPLNIDEFDGIDQYQFSSLIRFWIHESGLKSPSSRQLLMLYGQIIVHKSTTAVVDLKNATIRFFDGRLYLTKILGPASPETIRWNLQDMDIPNYGIKIVTHDVIDGGLNKNRLTEHPLRLCWRKGGERMTLLKRTHSSALKKLFQQRRIPPWQRDNLPILMAGEKVAWVAGIGPSDQFSQKAGGTGIYIEFSPL